MELETHYSLRCLLNAQSGLRSTAAELAKLRRRLDKMLREKGMETARPVHDSIVRGKEKLCSLLNGSRLSLLEIGQEELASASQKLVCSVRHFPIMAPDYTPMLTGVLKFADLLPIKDDSLSAALGHLANLAKIGYYPTDPAHVAYLSQALVFPENSKINLLDPCCGEGLALERIAQGQNCHTFGVELDDSRARQACEHLERVAMGSYFYSRISHNAFQLLYLNPPYLSTISEAERRTFESKFSQEIAVQEKALAFMRSRYHQMAAFLTALKPGIICPQCRRPVKEDEILDCEIGLKSVLAECKEQGGGIKRKQQELLALETQSRRTFEDWKNGDMAEIQKEVEQLYREEEKAAQKAAQEQADYTAELEKISSRRQTIDVLLSCGNLTPAEEERLSELRKEIAAKDAVLDQLSRESSKPNQNVASQRDILQSQLNDVNARISAVVDYASVRNELLFKALHTPNVEFQLYDVVKKTGELVPAWKLRYRGTIYQCLSRSEKILAGLEVVELLKRLTGRCYPVFIDDSESVDHIPRPSGQALISKKVADQPLKVQVKNTSMNLPKAG